MKGKRFFYYGLPLLGTLLCLWYVKRATCDIVYTDYIRLVNSYLPDVWNPAKIFCAGRADQNSDSLSGKNC